VRGRYSRVRRFGHLALATTLRTDGDTRLPQLDTLRGLAALSVVFWHAAIVWPGFADNDPSPAWLLPLKRSPLHALWAGQEAVILFFVLSGFVLALPFCSRQVPVLGFLIRRVLRLYPAYALATLLAVPAIVLTSSIAVPGTSVWFAGTGAHGVSVSTVLNQLTLVGVRDSSAANPVIWSLIVEMRLSLVFPLLVWVALRYPWQLVMPAAGLVMIVDTHAPLLQWDSLHTLGLALLFLAGIYLARYRHEVVRLYAGLPPIARAGAVVAGITAYCYHYVSPAWAPQGYSAEIVVAGLGSAILIVAALQAGESGSFLRHRFLLVLGRCSYSVYLFHPIVLFAAIRLLSMWVGVGFAEAIGLALVVPVALIAYRFVELPGIQLGQRLARRLSSSRLSRVAA
jgi:peptidoglycan/LPS O-acetylase OafA/YrhL